MLIRLFSVLVTILAFTDAAQARSSDVQCIGATGLARVDVYLRDSKTRIIYIDPSTSLDSRLAI